MAQSRKTGGHLITWICLACRAEIYSRGLALGVQRCPRCGGSVLRPDDTPAHEDGSGTYLAEAS